MIIHSISGPRNISTALMYSFAQRKDITPVDEPFYAAYLKMNPELIHPGKTDVLLNQSSDPNSVREEIITWSKGDKHVYVKDMAHHFTDAKLAPFPNSKAIFLVRDPAKLIASFQKVIPRPTLKDIGIADELNLFQQFRSTGIPAFVVPTETLAAHPEQSLSLLCEVLGLPMDKRMLNWSVGPKGYDGCWAPYWYANAHQSSGFMPFKSNYPELDKHGSLLLEEALPHYQSLLENNIL